MLNWIGAYELGYYLYSSDYCNYGRSIVSYPYPNLYSGNPVYWEGTNNYSAHIMLCVGKNSSGVPVICAHTSDAYRMPITNYTDRTLYTIPIATSELHTSHTNLSGYYASPSNHYYVCKYCELRRNIASHTMFSGSCLVCGYSGPHVYD